jgi:hypothetical protein
MATTSGTSAFDLDLSEIVEEAFERCGAELRTGYDLRTARRSLNLMFTDWANRGLNMWTFEQGQIVLSQGQSTYALPTDTVDLIEHVIRTGAGNVSTQADLTITRISVSTYATIPNKLQQARPIQIWIQRMNAQSSPTGATLNGNVQIADTTITVTPNTDALPPSGFVKIGAEIIYYGGKTSTTLTNCARGQSQTAAAFHATGSTVTWEQLPAVTVWPTPDNTQTYTLVYWRLRRTQDAGDGVNVMDVPFRFVNAMVAGLSYYMALKIPGAMERLPMLKQQYDEAWDLASSEDREKAAVRFVPRRAFMGWGT